MELDIALCIRAMTSCFLKLSAGFDACVFILRPRRFVQLFRRALQISSGFCFFPRRGSSIGSDGGHPKVKGRGMGSIFVEWLMAYR